MLYALIDIGSNTVRMAIYRIEGGRAEMLMKKKHAVGLAAHLKDGIMQQSGIDRTVEIVNGFRAFLLPFGIENVVAFTTAALRNARNSAEAVGEIERRTGLSIRIITGDEEAEYDFIGAVHGLKEDSGVIIDIGGASTELVAFKNRAILTKTSLPIGSLALYANHVKALLPTAKEIAVMREEVERIIRSEEAFVSIHETSLVGIGGTFKGASALCSAMFHQEAASTHLAVETIEEMIRYFSFAGVLTMDMTVLLMKNVPERMHTVMPGLVIADVLAGWFHAKEITYSDSGVREGYIYAEILK